MKKYFKYLLPVVLAVVLIMPMTAKAATTAEIQAQINAIMQQIQALRQQIAQLQAQQGISTTWCHTFNTNLKIGDQGYEVIHLITALNREGFSVSGSNFSEEVASAVTGFQEKYKSEILTPLNLKYGTGYVGKATRAKLNKLYGCGGNVTPPPFTCTQIACASNQKTVCPAGLDDRGCPLVCKCVPGPIECPLYSLPLCKEGEKIVSEGKDANGCQLPGRCIPSTGNQPPVISGVSGPTALNVNQTGTWTVSASDPEQGILSYSVIWGDEGAFIGSTSTLVPTTYVQTATFTHSYSKAGIYNPSFNVADDKGLSARTSISVNVGAVTTPSITVLSPNGGEAWQKDSTQLIKWSATPTISTVDIYLTIPYPSTCTPPNCVAMTAPLYIVHKTLNDGVFEWKVGTYEGGSLGSGQYYMDIIDPTNYTVFDSSDALFSIVAAVGGALAPSGQYSASILENMKMTLDQIQKAINDLYW